MSERWRNLTSALNGLQSETLQALRCGLVADTNICPRNWTIVNEPTKTSSATIEGGCLFGAAVLATGFSLSADQWISSGRVEQMIFEAAITRFSYELGGMSVEEYQDYPPGAPSRDHLPFNRVIEAFDTWGGSGHICKMKGFAGYRGHPAPIRRQVLTTRSRLQLITAIEKILHARNTEPTCVTLSPVQIKKETPDGARSLN